MKLSALPHLSLLLLGATCLALCIGLPHATALDPNSPSASHSAAPSNQITVQLKWYHQFQFAGYYAALSQGYYQKEGLDVCLLEGKPNQSALQSVITKRATYGVSDSDILLARLQGKPVVAMAAIFQHTPYILMTRLDRAITHPRQLLGRKVMVNGEQGMTLVKTMLIGQGIDPAKVMFEPHTGRLEDLINAKTDAMSAYYTSEPAQMQALGVQVASMRAIDFGVDFYGDTLFTLEEEIQQHPARAAAFLRATLKGWRHAFDHTEQTIEHILQMPSVKQRALTAEMLRYEADKMQQLVLPNVVEIGSMSPERWRRMADTYAAAGLAPTSDFNRLEGFLYSQQRCTHARLLSPATVACASLLVLLLSIFAGVWMQKRVRSRTAELAQQNTQMAISQANYRELFNISNDAIFVHSAGSLRLLDANNRACELFGYEREQLLGLTVEDISAETISAKARLSNLFRKVITEGPQLFEWPCLHSSGHQFWGEVHLKRGIINGHDCLFALVRDITERKRFEEDRLKVSKLDALGVIAGGIAHDLNNIMLSIVLNLDLLLGRARLDADDAALVASAKSASLRASDLARRMLTFAKGGDPVKTEVNIRELIINSLNLALRDSNLLGSVQIEPNLPPIYADPSQLSQVLDNLIINAREASPRGGNLIIGARRVQLQAGAIGQLPAADYLQVDVQDEGTGIPASLLSKIFDPYFTTKKTGHGIGLATCYSILKKHGGDILAVSSPGHGTTFTFYLPILATTQSPTPPPTTSVPHPVRSKPAPKERILVVDDDTLILNTLALLLKTLGYQEVETVENGEAALPVYQQAMEVAKPFDLVILDATIPGHLGGEEAFKALRQIDPNARVILSSGYTDSSTTTLWQEIGFCALLPKPFTMQELDVLLTKLQERKKRLLKHSAQNPPNA